MNIIKFLGNYEFIHYAEKVLLEDFSEDSKILELPAKTVWNEAYLIPAYLYSEKFLLCRGFESIVKFIEKYEGKKYNLISNEFVLNNRKDIISYLSSKNAKYFVLIIRNTNNYELKEVSLNEYTSYRIQDVKIGEIYGERE